MKDDKMAEGPGVIYGKDKNLVVTPQNITSGI
jgi:hypothetical protein